LTRPAFIVLEVWGVASNSHSPFSFYLIFKVMIVRYSIGDLVFVKDFIGDSNSQIGLVLEITARIPQFITYKILLDKNIIEISDVFLDSLDDIYGL